MSERCRQSIVLQHALQEGHTGTNVRPDMSSSHCVQLRLLLSSQQACLGTPASTVWTVSQQGHLRTWDEMRRPTDEAAAQMPMKCTGTELPATVWPGTTVESGKGTCRQSLLPEQFQETVSWRLRMLIRWQVLAEPERQQMSMHGGVCAHPSHSKPDPRCSAGRHIMRQDHCYQSPPHHLCSTTRVHRSALVSLVCSVAADNAGCQSTLQTLPGSVIKVKPS